MKPVIPHEHGGWAMLTVPFLLGTFAGDPGWGHLLLFLAWLMFYLFTYSFKEWIKRQRRESRFVRWAVIYSVLGLCFLIIPLKNEPSLVWLAPLLCISFVMHLWHVKRKNERAMTNNVGAVHAFSVGAVAACVFGTGKWDVSALFVYVHSAVYYLGSVFFVKSILREKNNPRWMGYAKTYHWLMLPIPALFGQPLLFIPFLFSLVRLYRWGGKPLQPIRIGMIEFANSAQFLILSVWLL
ncbi:YwiC-like family protein [Staphylospora marina]|uniref:YwiC-like family protein n=1 Tax=Staphylospora marina TaxID=2490858 RepID=UPI000F5C21F1|nr:YwiC-like family protein [Staphylospora marina]